MKLLFLVTIIGLVFGLDDKVGREEFTRFKSLYKKTYDSIYEENLRYQIFALQLDRIALVNTDYNNKKSLYKVALNQYSDLAYNEFLAKRGGLLVSNLRSVQSPASRPLPTKILNMQRQTLTSFDWRTTGHVTPVKDQATCGACWAFATAAALETQWSLYYGSLKNLSVQNLIDCVTTNFGCKGGLLTNSYDYIINKGINGANRYPFISAQGSCAYLKDYPEANMTSYRPITMGSEAELEYAIRQSGPVSVGIMASPDFINYNGGIFTGPDCTDRLNHAVVVVGFNNANNPPYWIVKNSWGLWWGESGYIRILKGKNLCGIANMAYYPVL